MCVSSTQSAGSFAARPLRPTRSLSTTTFYSTITRMARSINTRVGFVISCRCSRRYSHRCVRVKVQDFTGALPSQSEVVLYRINTVYASDDSLEHSWREQDVATSRCSGYISASLFSGLEPPGRPAYPIHPPSTKCNREFSRW